MQLSEAAKVKARQERLLREESAARTSEAIAAEHTRLTLEQERLATESYVCVYGMHTALHPSWHGRSVLLTLCVLCVLGISCCRKAKLEAYQVSVWFS